MRVSKHTTAKVFGLVVLLAASTALAQIPPFAGCPSGGFCDNPEQNNHGQERNELLCSGTKSEAGDI